ncbi:MAG: hypothetical protein GY756_09105 [bacterium]|nr:hypothetical protein [bacterium]
MIRSLITLFLLLIFYCSISSGESKKDNNSNHAVIGQNMQNNSAVKYSKVTQKHEQDTSITAKVSVNVENKPESQSKSLTVNSNKNDQKLESEQVNSKFTDNPKKNNISNTDLIVQCSINKEKSKPESGKIILNTAHGKVVESKMPASVKQNKNSKDTNDSSGTQFTARIIDNDDQVIPQTQNKTTVIMDGNQPSPVVSTTDSKTGNSPVRVTREPVTNKNIKK